MKKPVTLLLIAFFFCFNAHCFGQSDSTYERTYTKARNAYRSGEYTIAASICQSVLKNKDLNSKNTLRFRLLQSAIIAATGDLDSAIYHAEMGLKSAQEDDPKVLVTYVYLAIYNGRLAHYEESIRYARSALALDFDEKTSSLKALNFNTLGLVYRNLSRYDTATYYLKESLKIRKKNGDERGMADCYNNLAAIKASLGYFNSALEYHKHALNIRKRVFGVIHSNTAYSYNNIGHCYLNMNNYDSAEHYFLKSLEIKKQVSGTDHPSLVTTLMNLGEIKTAQKDFEPAREYFATSIDLGKKSWTTWHPKVSDSYVGLADLFVNQEKFDEALIYYDSAGLVCNRVFSLPHKRISFILYRKSHALLKKGELKEALEVIEDGVEANILEETVALDNVLMVDLHAKKGEIAYALYQKSGYSRYLDASMASYKLCYKYLNEGRKFLNNRADRVRMSSLSKQVSAELLKILFQERENIKSKFDHLVWETIERSKINELQLSFSDDQDRYLAGLPNELGAYDKMLSDSITSIKYELQERGKDFDAVRKERLFTYKQKQDSLMEVYRVKFPKYYQLKYGHVPLTLDKVQRQLPGSTALLNYFIHNVNAYVLVVKKGAIQSFELNSQHSEQLVTRLYESLSTRSDDFKTHATALYKTFFPPVEESVLTGVEKLIISPDGILAKIPFEVLTKSKSKDEPNYLLRGYDISYHYSTSTLYSKTANNFDYKLKLAAYAPSYNSDGIKTYLREKTMSPLAWNKKEANAASQILDGSTFIDVNATETQFKQHVADTEVIHLSMHSVLNEQEPLLSHLLFDKDSSQSEDGVLHAYEVLNLDMKAKMAVLSGCQTSDGRVEEGEGLVSLGYAFTAAGVPTTITSKWSIDDKSTALLMTYFYENIAKGLSKSEALRKAKLKFIDGDNPAYAHPFYWGAFVLYGDDAPLQETPSYYWVILVVSIIVILAVSLFKFYRTKS